ncbi:hypothetical protein RUM43_004612 [Polyplax serrata]|uniref:Oxidoreductase-like domain-containing protein n=1 Tax=Polyplax serrata TaxID=468196 RepID=A0AAN8SBY4_POLSC
MLRGSVLSVAKNLKGFPNCRRWSSTITSNSTTGTQGIQPEMVNGVQLPPEPSHCCKSGCANCVWIKYAQEVAQLFDNGDMIAKKKIMEKVEDPQLRAFLFTQLGLNANQS